MNHLRLQLVNSRENSAVEQQIDAVVIGGWSGRDRQAVEEHIRELEALGVPRPEHTPCYYVVSTSRLTTDDYIEVVGNESSGEVEFVLLKRMGEIWIGVGSDHTDRKIETFDVNASKQVCDKPIADVMWNFRDVEDHWDDLQLQSRIIVDGERTLYQDGRVNELLHPLELIEQYEKLSNRKLADNSVMFGGTLPAIGKVRPSDRFELEIIDPSLGRKISHQYRISAL